MTITNVNPKVSAIGSQNDTPRPQNPVDEQSQTSRDAYASEGANPYRNLVSGHPRAVSIPPPDDSTPIGDMMRAVRNESTGRRQDPMQALIGSLMMGDDGAGPSPTDFELPRVPLLQRDILRRNTAGIGLRPIVERYVALEKVIQNLISNAQRAINSATTTHMDPREIESLRDYKGELIKRLILCRGELAEARQAYRREQSDHDDRRPEKVLNGIEANTNTFKTPSDPPHEVEVSSTNTLSPQAVPANPWWSPPRP